MNDDVEAALALGCGVHLGQADPGAERAAAAGIPLGISARTRREAAVAEFSGATYIGAGPVWATPSKPDAAAPIGLDGLADVCLAVTVPVVAIGGIDASNAADVHPGGCGRCRRDPRRLRPGGRTGGGRCGSLRRASSGCCASSSREG